MMLRERIQKEEEVKKPLIEEEVKVSLRRKSEPAIEKIESDKKPKDSELSLDQIQKTKHFQLFCSKFNVDDFVKKLIHIQERIIEKFKVMNHKTVQQETVYNPLELGFMLTERPKEL